MRKKYTVILAFAVALTMLFGLTMVATADEVVPENAIILDLSPGGNHAIVVGQPEYEPLDGTTTEDGEIALWFDGESYLETQVTAEDLNIEGDKIKTIEAWARAEAFDDNGAIFSVGAPGADGEDLALRVTGEENGWRTQLWGGYDVDFEYPSLNEWVHFAVVHTGVETILYANGEEVAAAAQTLSTSPDEVFRIGWWSRREEDQGFVGAIDEVRVWDTVRTQEEIQENMKQILTGEEDNLVGYWNFEAIEIPEE